MKHLAALLAIILGSACHLHAVDLSEIAAAPAAINAVKMEPTKLAVSAEKKGWLAVSDGLLSHSAVIYRPVIDHLGIADFTVTRSGYLLLACNFDYQGNESGEWQKEAWDERKFKLKGWKALKNSALGGALIQSDKREQILFWKKVSAGERFVLRCNKYDPPYPIVFR